MRLFIDPEDLKHQYDASPAWLKALMNPWADGLNYYLHKHTKTKPRVISHFEPWMPLSFSEGNIGGDIEHVDVRALEAFYSKPPLKQAASLDLCMPAEPGGSNGIAIAHVQRVWQGPSPDQSAHIVFLSRRSPGGQRRRLNAYGAVTWGQFFVYQGFNDRVGWMHTSSGVDNIDEYRETIARRTDGLYYRYGTEWRPVIARKIQVPYKTPTGTARKEFTIFRTHHGPIVRAEAIVPGAPASLPPAAVMHTHWIPPGSASA